MKKVMDWSPKVIAKMTRMWAAGKMAQEICDAIGAPSRDAVIGKAHRLGLPEHPIKTARREAAQQAEAVRAEKAPMRSKVKTKTAHTLEARERRRASPAHAGREVRKAEDRRRISDIKAAAAKTKSVKSSALSRSSRSSVRASSSEQALIEATLQPGAETTPAIEVVALFTEVKVADAHVQASDSAPTMAPESVVLASQPEAKVVELTELADIQTVEPIIEVAPVQAAVASEVEPSAVVEAEVFIAAPAIEAAVQTDAIVVMEAVPGPMSKVTEPAPEPVVAIEAEDAGTSMSEPAASAFEAVAVNPETGADEPTFKVRLKDAPNEGLSPRGPVRLRRSSGEASAEQAPPLSPDSPYAHLLGLSWKGAAQALDLLREGRCKWPVGDPKKSAFAYCGDPRVSGAVYCETHKKMAYQPPATRKTTAARLLLSA